MKPEHAALAVALWRLLAACQPAAAQGIPWPRGDRLTVQLAPDSISPLGGSGLMLRYGMANAATSEQTARVLMIETRVPVVALRAPDDSRQWVHVGPQPGDSVSFWGSAAPQQDVAPGSARSGFVIESGAGLPGIVHFWVEGRYAVPTVTEAQEDSVQQPRIEENSFRGLTVGAEPVADVSLAGLADRLRGLGTRACSLAWITNAGVCRSLQAKLDAAAASLRRGDAQSATGQLQAFLAELEAQHGRQPGKHVTDNAYWLLKVNAQYLQTRF
jgi:hypothetical protein